MILREDVLQIGTIQRAHGLQGELAFTFSSDIFDEIEIPYFICEIDGILVPFFVESYRFKNDDTGLVKFEGIDNDEEAKILLKSALYIEKKLLPSDTHQSEIEGNLYFIGFKVTNQEGETIGKITDIDDETENVLFLVVNENGEEYIIPACDEYIIAMDEKNKVIQMALPEGLLDLSLAIDAEE